MYKQPHPRQPVPEPCVGRPPSTPLSCCFPPLLQSWSSCAQRQRGWEGRARWGRGGCFMQNIPGAQTHSKWLLAGESSWRPKSDLASPGWGHCWLFTHTPKCIFCLPEGFLCLERRGPPTPSKGGHVGVVEREDVKRLQSPIRDLES